MGTVAAFLTKFALLITFNSLLYAFDGILSLLANWLSKLVFWAASIKGITQLEQVTIAWSIVRDFSNMFFIIILLVIAFGTILNIEAYSYKKLLGKLVIAAILVNFSKTICGIMIDAAEVVMFSFLNAISEVADVGFLSAFKLHTLMLPSTSDFTGGFDNSTATLALLVIFFMLCAFITLMLIYIVLLLGRFCVLCLLTILSPFAYVLNILPQTQSYAKKWWSTFGQFVILGPATAFLLWLFLFLATYKGTSLTDHLDMANDSGINAGISGITQATDSATLINYLIAFMFLTYGAKLVKDMSGEFGEITGKISSAGKAATGLLMKRGVFGAEKAARGLIGRGMGAGGKYLASKGGRLGGLGKGLQSVGGFFGSQVNLHPEYLAGTAKKIFGEWTGAKEKREQAQLASGMAQIASPFRTGFKAFMDSQDHARAAREGTVANDVISPLNGSLGLDEIRRIIADQSIPPAAKDAAIQAAIDSVLNNREARSAADDQVTAAIANLTARRDDANTSADERQRLQADIDQLTGISTVLGRDDEDWVDADRNTFLDLVRGDPANPQGGVALNALGSHQRYVQDYQQRMASLSKWQDIMHRWAEPWSGDAEFKNEGARKERVADKYKKFEESLQGNAQAIVTRLQQAIATGAGEDIEALTQLIVSNRCLDDMPTNPALMQEFLNTIEQDAVAKARRLSDAERGGRSAEQVGQTVRRDASQNYLNQEYMNVFLRSLMSRANGGNATQTNKALMTLGNMAASKGVHTAVGLAGYNGVTQRAEGYDSTLVDMGGGNFRMQANPQQLNAQRGVLGGQEGEVAIASAHHSALVTRNVAGNPTGVNSQFWTYTPFLTSTNYESSKRFSSSLRTATANPAVLANLRDTLRGPQRGQIATRYRLNDTAIKNGIMHHLIVTAFQHNAMTRSQGAEWFRDHAGDSEEDLLNMLDGVIAAVNTPNPTPEINDVMRIADL